MDLDYSGEHSINFYGASPDNRVAKNTWRDFHLIPVSRPSIVYPSPNIRIVAIPGTNKRLDITDYHIGGLTFGPRSGTWEFYIDHNQYSNWVNAYNIMVAYFHGKELYAALVDDPMVFYKGIFSVNSYVSGSSYSKVTIQYDLDYDMTIGLLSNYPIKFIGQGDIPYANNYAVKPNTNYVIDLGDNKKELLVYDLSVLSTG